MGTRGVTRPRTWYLALSRGNVQAAVFRWLLEWAGRDPLRWEGTEEALQGRLSRAALGFVHEHSIARRWAMPGERPVRMAARYVYTQWKPHLAHGTFGRPRYKAFADWSEEEKMAHHVGVDEAQRRLMLRAGVRKASNALQAAQAAGRANLARAYAREGLAPSEIAHEMEVGLSTVYRYLEEAEGA